MLIDQSLPPTRITYTQAEYTRLLINLGVELDLAAQAAEVLAAVPEPWSQRQTTTVKWALLSIIRHEDLLGRRVVGGQR